MSNVLIDMKSSIQAILQQPAEAFVLLMVLAFGIGANVAIFPYANGLFQNLESHPDHLVRFYTAAGISFSRVAGIFMLIAGAVLLVICANAAGTMLSRFFPHKQELTLFSFFGGITGLIISQGWQDLLLWLPGVTNTSSFRTFGIAILATFLSALLAAKGRQPEAGASEVTPLEYDSPAAVVMIESRNTRALPLAVSSTPETRRPSILQQSLV